MFARLARVARSRVARGAPARPLGAARAAGSPGRDRAPPRASRVDDHPAARVVLLSPSSPRGFAADRGPDARGSPPDETADAEDAAEGDEAEASEASDAPEAGASDEASSSSPSDEASPSSSSPSDEASPSSSSSSFTSDRSPSLPGIIGAPPPGGVGGDPRGGKALAVNTLRPSIWTVFRVAFRSLKTLALDVPWIRSCVDAEFDPAAFLADADEARAAVLRAFAENDQRALREMCHARVFEAMQATRIEYDRANVDVEVWLEGHDDDEEEQDSGEEEEEEEEDSVSSSSTASPAVLVDVGVSVADLTEEEGARVVEGLRRYAREGAGEEGTSFEMDAGLSAPARISVTARFQRREVWTMRNRVSGERGRTDDARGSEWTFTRELPRRLPVRGELETPWRLDDIA
mgnify:CR=1 FL=1